MFFFPESHPSAFHFEYRHRLWHTGCQYRPISVNAKAGWISLTFLCSMQKPSTQPLRNPKQDSAIQYTPIWVYRFLNLNSWHLREIPLKETRTHKHYLVDSSFTATFLGPFPLAQIQSSLLLHTSEVTLMKFQMISWWHLPRNRHICFSQSSLFCKAKHHTYGNPCGPPVLNE